MTILREGVLLIEFAVLVLYAVIMLFKKVKPARFFLNLAFGLYISVVIAVCFFPIKFSGTLPEPAMNNFIPFKSIFDSVKDVLSGSTYGLFSVFGNFIMLVPLGVFFYFYFKEKKMRLLGVFLFSVSIETIQCIIGMLIGYNYRCIDIDDVILNTAGGILSVILFDLIFGKLKKNRKSKPAEDSVS